MLISGLKGLNQDFIVKDILYLYTFREIQELLESQDQLALEGRM